MKHWRMSAIKGLIMYGIESSHPYYRVEKESWKSSLSSSSAALWYFDNRDLTEQKFIDTITSAVKADFSTGIYWSKLLTNFLCQLNVFSLQPPCSNCIYFSHISLSTAIVCYSCLYTSHTGTFKYWVWIRFFEFFLELVK